MTFAKLVTAATAFVVSTGVTYASTITERTQHHPRSQSLMVHGIVYNGVSRAEASPSFRPPLVDRLPVPAIPCPRLEGYPDCH
jgi:hypothetical protein